MLIAKGPFVDKHRESVQAIHVVTIGEVGVLALSLPGLEHHAAHGGHLAQVNDERWPVSVVVVHDGAVGERVVFVAVDRQRRMTLLEQAQV